MFRSGKEACIPIADNLLDTLLTLISTNIKQVKNKIEINFAIRLCQSLPTAGPLCLTF